MSAKGFVKDLRSSFLRGLAAVLPVFLTIGILIWVCVFIYKYIGKYANTLTQWITVQIMASRGDYPVSWAGPESIWTQVTDFWDKYTLVWIGFVLAFILIYIIGRFVASFIGRGVLRTIEGTAVKLPILKQVYPSVKQVTDFLLSEHKIQFSRVVLVEYPRKGAWSVGLVTSGGMKAIQNSKMDYLTVFIPSSPMPVTGYTIMVSRDDVVDLPVSIDEALKFTVSGGVLVPPAQQVDVDLGPMHTLMGTDSEE